MGKFIGGLVVLAVVFIAGNATGYGVGASAVPDDQELTRYCQLEHVQDGKQKQPAKKPQQSQQQNKGKDGQ